MRLGSVLAGLLIGVGSVAACGDDEAASGDNMAGPADGPSVTIVCETAYLDAPSLAVGGPAVPMVMTMLITNGGIERFEYRYGSPDFRHDRPLQLGLDRKRRTERPVPARPDPADIELPELINRGILGDFLPQTSDQEFRKH